MRRLLGGTHAADCKCSLVPGTLVPPAVIALNIVIDERGGGGRNKTTLNHLNPIGGQGRSHETNLSPLFTLAFLVFNDS